LSVFHQKQNRLDPTVMACFYFLIARYTQMSCCCLWYICSLYKRLWTDNEYIYIYMDSLCWLWWPVNLVYGQQI